MAQDVLVFNNTRLVRRVEALQEEIQVTGAGFRRLSVVSLPADSLSLPSAALNPTQAAADSEAPSSSNWQWSWISGSPSTSKQPDPLQQAKVEIAALRVRLLHECGREPAF